MGSRGKDKIRIDDLLATLNLESWKRNTLSIRKDNVPCRFHNCKQKKN